MGLSKKFQADMVSSVAACGASVGGHQRICVSSGWSTIGWGTLAVSVGLGQTNSKYSL